MFVIEVTWKAEWVGGLTFETHPAHRDAVPHAAPTQTRAQLNSLKSSRLDAGHFSKRLTACQAGARKCIYRFTCVGVLLLLPFSPLLLALWEDGGKKKKPRQLDESDS